MCVEEPLERPNYFMGMVLGADDLETEQAYLLARMRRHNRYLHGYGTVCGLRVMLQEGKVLVEPGLAIDCAGNELVLSEWAAHPLPQRGGRVYVTAVYEEHALGAVPTRAGSGDERTQPARMREGCRIELLEADPQADHEGLGPGTPGCGMAHPLTLACLVRGPVGWRIAAQERGRGEADGCC